MCGSITGKQPIIFSYIGVSICIRMTNYKYNLYNSTVPPAAAICAMLHIPITYIIIDYFCVNAKHYIQGPLYENCEWLSLINVSFFYLSRQIAFCVQFIFGVHKSNHWVEILIVYYKHRHTNTHTHKHTNTHTAKTHIHRARDWGSCFLFTNFVIFDIKG